MKRTLPLLLILLTVGARPGSTQKTAAGLTDQQKLGRQVLMQSCAVCHLPSGPDAKTYGPSLNKSTIPEDDDTVAPNHPRWHSAHAGLQIFPAAHSG